MRRQDLVRALITALIVGPTLIAINQGGALFGDADLRILPAALTFLVPFIVSISSSVLSRKNG